MRGIETGKVRIRHEVFTEIARLAYEGGDYAKRLEELPFKIIPGEIGTYRDSLFLERAVVGERLRLAMGLPLRKFSEFSLLSDGVEKALDPEKIRIYRSKLSGRDRIGVIYGDYPTRELAAAELASIARSSPIGNPYVRSVSKLR